MLKKTLLSVCVYVWIELLYVCLSLSLSLSDLIPNSKAMDWLLLFKNVPLERSNPLAHCNLCIFFYLQNKYISYLVPIVHYIVYCKQSILNKLLGITLLQIKQGMWFFKKWTLCPTMVQCCRCMKAQIKAGGLYQSIGPFVPASTPPRG